jgi:hypothetical protein
LISYIEAWLSTTEWEKSGRHVTRVAHLLLKEVAATAASPQG